MTVLKIALVLAAAYVAVVAVLYAVQDRLLFPAGMAVQVGTPVPPDAARLKLAAADGSELHGVRLVPDATPVVSRTVILGFGGNAWNAEDVAVYLANLYPHAEVVVFHYRGYAPSTGRASVDALIADAPLIYDAIAEEARKTEGEVRFVAAGFSIGSGVAVHLARERKVDGLLLVTPFDSLAALAGHHFSWVPAARLIKNPMRNRDLLKGLDVPTAILAAEHDDIIPRERTSEMRGAARRMVYSRTIKEAGHNDIYGREDFAIAMREALAAIERAWP
ncbi:MAG: alpha/beta hydrolase [Rhodospirillaceae bacterium]